MTDRYYKGQGERGSEDLEFPGSLRKITSDARGYIAEKGLVAAANTAITLAQPLLLTGDPGTGKTEFASSLAWEIDKPLLRFEAKSDSTARDLFYTYDALGQFQAAQSGNEDTGARDYISFSALGRALLLSKIPAETADLLPDRDPGDLPHRSVVLVDEIDKAPRDFPNDMLTEIEELNFRIPELGGRRVEGDADLHPFIVITSNSEKDLPDAFLRRCIYYDIPFPDPATLRRILKRRLEGLIDLQDEFLDAALEIFNALRANRAGLHRKPATAELIGWLRALRSDSESVNPIADDWSNVESTIGVLVKTRLDLDSALGVLKEQREQREQKPS